MANSAINWNRMPDDFTKIFWDQNVRQFWVDEEIPLADDKLTYMTLTKEEKLAYERLLGALTLLDTKQGDIGLPLMSLATDNLHHKSVLSFMAAMEHMHAKSYSSIFSTLCTMDRIDEIFEWVENHDFLQQKLSIVIDTYNNISSQRTIFEAMSTSVFLERFLFYSGFFYPLYLSGHGKLVNSGEIINLIIRDEAIHCSYVSMIAKNVFDNLSSSDQIIASKNVINIMLSLYEHEVHYNNDLFSDIGLNGQVEKFMQYNADKALELLSIPSYFNVSSKDVNPIVINGLLTETKNHDFFSTKGNGYIKTTKVEALSDSDFEF